MSITIICGEKTIAFPPGTLIRLDQNNLGNSMVGETNLYSYGFSFIMLRDNDLIIDFGASKVVIECPKTVEDRLVAAFVAEFKLSEYSARRRLQLADWNYRQAAFRLAHPEQFRPTPCGEISLGPSELCNIEVVEGNKEAYERIKEWVGSSMDIRGKGHYIQVAGDTEAKPVFDVFDKAGVVCGCQEGMIGTEHCPIHGSDPLCVCAQVGRAHCRACRPNLELGESGG